MLTFATLTLTANLDALLDQADVTRGSSYGVVVQDADGHIIYDRNGGTRLVPASNQKIFATLYALYSLGTDTVPWTHIWSEPDAIYVSTNGNPLVKQSDLRAIAARPGWNKNRPVIISQAYAPGYPASWEYDDLPNRYAAPVYALTVDNGGFELWSEKGKLAPVPKEFGLSVKHHWTKDKAKVYYDPMRRMLTVVGSLPQERTMQDTLSIPRPDEAAARFLGSEARHGSQLPNRAPDITLTSPAATMELVKKCLQPSDNQLAEQLLLMAAHRQGPLDKNSPYPEARERLESFARLVVGLGDETFRPMDGSGLSRHNWVTAAATARALGWASRQPWAEKYRAAMAAPGTGTLRSRLAGSTFQGKTGTLSGVVGLSGYLRTADGQDLIVSIIINNSVQSSAKVRELADQIVRTVENAGSTGTALVYSEGTDGNSGALAQVLSH